MVTTAILSVILVMAMQVTESTRNSIRIAESRSNNDAIARQVFDQISSDISNMQAGTFARIEFNTNSGNDDIAFLSSTPGLTDEGKPGKRAISQIHYSIINENKKGEKLVRGMRGYDFDDTLKLDPEKDFTDIPTNNQIVASENVIRLEVEYLVEKVDRSDPNSPKTTMARETIAPETTENLRALVLSLVTVDAWTRRALRPEQLQNLSNKFPDATRENPTLEIWSQIRDGLTRSELPGYPRQTLQSIRCYQRTILTP